MLRIIESYISCTADPTKSRAGWGEVLGEDAPGRNGAVGHEFGGFLGGCCRVGARGGIKLKSRRGDRASTLRASLVGKVSCAGTRLIQILIDHRFHVSAICAKDQK